MSRVVEDAIARRVKGAVRDVKLEIDGVTVTVHWNLTWYAPNPHQIHAEDVYRGTCVSIEVVHSETDRLRSVEPVRIDGVTGDGDGADDDSPVPAVELLRDLDHHHVRAGLGDQWHIVWIAERERPVRIDGVTDADLPEAVAVLVDTARADRVYRRLRQRRLDRTREVLRQALAEREVTLALPVTARYLPHQDADRRLGYLVERAVINGDLTPDQLTAEFPGAEEHVRTVAHNMSIGSDDFVQNIEELFIDRHYRPSPIYCDISAIAERAGLSEATIRAYRARGAAAFPQEDITIGGTPGWEWDTVEHWLATRRGRGWAHGTVLGPDGRREHVTLTTTPRSAT